MGCNIKHPLIRDGVSQNQRFIAPLNPAYAKVDERTLIDLLYFLARYAKEINFYNLENKIEGTWYQFFEKNSLVIISIISKQDPEDINTIYTRILNELKNKSISEKEIQDLFKTLFSFLFSLLYEFEKWYQQSHEGYLISVLLKDIISTQLKPVLKQLIAFYLGAIADPPLFGKPSQNHDKIYGYEISGSDEILKNGFTEVWRWWLTDNSPEEENNWIKYQENVDGNTDVYGSNRFTMSVPASEKIVNALSEFTLLFNVIIKVLKRLAKQASEAANDLLANFSAHEPHSGLIISFLHLFQYAQSHINTITKRHLDFYYQNVLKLATLDAEPDKAVLIIELAKHVDTFKIEKDTVFKAGKDELGNEVFYKSEREKVLNKAQVSHLRSVYIDKGNDWRVYASPFANSADGQGTAFVEKNKRWKAFGEPQAKLIEKTMVNADVGFAITSPLLNLSGGRRNIQVKFSFPSEIDFKKSDITNSFVFAITGEKGWITKNSETDFDFEVIIQKNTCIISLKLFDGVGPVVAYNSKIHGGSFNTSLPLLKLTINPSVKSYLYKAFHKIPFQEIGLQVSVFGLKNVIVQNDFGILNSTKPFQPFGAEPSVGSTFYVGSPEVFNKHLDKLLLTLKWHKLPITGGTGTQPNCNFNRHYNYNELALDLHNDPFTYYDPDNSDFKASYEILKDGVWNEVFPSGTDDGAIFNENAFAPRAFVFNGDKLGLKTNSNYENFIEYTPEVKQGFIRLKLREPADAFGHKFYIPLLTKQTLEEETDLPVVPYTPEISDVSLTYDASEKLNLTVPIEENKNGSGYFHIHPFGFQGINKKVCIDKFFVFPQFSHTENHQHIKHHGEFIIGFSSLKPPQNLSVLFKVAEGSSSPKAVKQEVNWFYLSSDNWIKFEKNEILFDETNGLLTSGIVEFSIPAKANDKNTILEPGYFWLKASLNKSPDSVCDMIDVKSQAVNVVFSDNNNDPDFLEFPTKEGSISKLLDSKPEIKKVAQPYSSYGGKPDESDQSFYRRISERLRHKNRGISIWDYERLVLEKFPEVYKVKCISHSHYDFSDKKGNLISSEFEPGFITVVAVGKLKNQNAVNPLEPCLSLNTLEAIRKFLVSKVSAFAAPKLRVINPLFEKIQIVCDVEFYEGYDEGYYLAKLAEDIKQFLSPWIYDEGKDIIFGGKLHKTVVLNYVEERSYVNFVTNFIMNHRVDKKISFENIGEAIATSARSVLVSHPDHKISINSICK